MLFRIGAAHQGTGRDNGSYRQHANNGVGESERQNKEEAFSQVFLKVIESSFEII
jgi:hypothetical protein